MSVFSASGLLSPAQAAEYTAALLSLLGSANPLAVLRDTPRLLRQELEMIPGDRISTLEAPGKWSARMIVAHLADSELVAAFRLRMMLAHDRPQLAAYDQDLWATRLRYETADPKSSLERFTVLRVANLLLWGSASPEELRRVGQHGERGEESVERMRRLHAGHDLVHLRQLARLRILLGGQ